MGVAGLAGCPSDSGSGGETPEDGGADTETPADSGGEDPTATPTDDSSEATATDRQAVTDSIAVGIANSPDVFNWNPWTPQDNTIGDLWMTELYGLSNVHTGDNSYSGAAIPTPHKPDHDEIEVMTWIEDHEVEPPYDWRQHYDDRSEFWNGDPFDADALVTHNHVQYFHDGNKFAEGATYNQEAEDQWTRHGWFDKGEVPDQDPNPVSTPVLETEASRLNFNPPTHPDFTQPYVEKYQDASSTDQVESVTNDLGSDRISLQRIQENGWGSGPYVLESMDDVGSEKAVLHLDPDHPNAEHTNVEKLELYWAEGDRLQTLQTNGEIDVNPGPVTETSTLNREALPDHMQELSRWLNTTRGDMWKLNWHNPHLQRLWVRRAMVEAIDWNAVSANGWGEDSAIVTEHDTFLLDAESERVFSQEFLDSLHTYSRESDTETADEYMRRAGYSRQGGQWVDPQGNTAAIDLSARSGSTSNVQAGQTIRENLASWGFGVNFTTQGWSTWSNSLKPNQLNYDSTLFWSDTATVYGKYNDRGAWWGEALLGGSPSADSPFRLTDDDEVDTQNKPVHVELPEEVGSIEAPDQAGRDPDLENGREVDMLEVVDAIRQPGNSDEELQELYRTCAQYYNFYVPHFVFQQLLAGSWGNVRDFEWPEPDAQALDYERFAGIENAVVLSGITQASTDEDFPSP